MKAQVADVSFRSCYLSNPWRRCVCFVLFWCGVRWSHGTFSYLLTCLPRCEHYGDIGGCGVALKLYFHARGWTGEAGWHDS